MWMPTFSSRVKDLSTASISVVIMAVGIFPRRTMSLLKELEFKYRTRLERDSYKSNLFMSISKPQIG